MLIAARANQGAFAAVLVSSTKSLLITVYTDRDERARVMGAFTATLTAGMAAGLVLGGVLTAELSYLAAHPASSTATSTVHGFAVAMTWGAAILLIAALPIGILINAKAPA
jgi:MFS family permease